MKTNLLHNNQQGTATKDATNETCHSYYNICFGHLLLPALKVFAVLDVTHVGCVYT